MTPCVLIIGGGHGGFGVATAIRDHADVVVLDVNDYTGRTRGSRDGRTGS